MMETPATMFKNLCKEIETEFIGAKLNSKEKAREWQRKINNIELWDIRYLKNYIAEFSQYYYKIGHNETNLGMFYDKLPYPICKILEIRLEIFFAQFDRPRPSQPKSVPINPREILLIKFFDIFWEVLRISKISLSVLLQNS